MGLWSFLMACTGLALMVATLVFSLPALLFILGGAMGIGAIVAGAKARKSNRKRLAIAGMVLGIVDSAFFLLICAGVIYAIILLLSM